MTEPTAKPPEAKPAPRRRPTEGKADRLAAALRANLARRKEQARSRDGASGPDPSPNPSPTPGSDKD